MLMTKKRCAQRDLGIWLRAFCLCTCAFLVSPALQAQAPTGLTVGTQAPRFMLPVIHGSDEKRFGPNVWTGQSAKIPKKWVLLSFFATYCAPCQKEMPELARLHKAYEDQGLGVFLVSIDKEKEKAEEVAELARSHDVNFPVLQDRFQVVARRYGAERLPYLLMLDEAGVVQKVHQGYSEEVQGILEAEVREGLGLPPLDEKKADVVTSAPSKKKSKKARRKRKSK